MHNRDMDAEVRKADSFFFLVKSKMLIILSSLYFLVWYLKPFFLLKLLRQQHIFVSVSYF